jgi:small-conductance mechanosensitive channel
MSKSQLLYFLTPLILILAGILAGVVFEKALIAKLTRLSAKARWPGDEIVIRALRGSLILGFIIAGVYSASLSVTLSPAFLAVFHKILQVLVIFTATMIASRIAGGLLNLYMSHEEGFLPSASILTNFTKAVVVGLGILIALQALGISITPILTALGVGGLAVALALQDTLSNLFSGLQIIASRDIKPGDYIRLSSGEEGHIVDISWRNTTIRALPSNIIIVPNAKLANAIITNYQQPDRELNFGVELMVGYGSDLKLVESVCIEAAQTVLRGHEGGVSDFEPVFRLKSFDDSGITVNVILRANSFTEQFALKHYFLMEIYQRFAQAGIEIPYPTRNVYLQRTD